MHLKIRGLQYSICALPKPSLLLRINLTKCIYLGNYLFHLFCKQAISNQQIYIYSFLLSIKYAISNLKYKSLNFYIFSQKIIFSPKQKRNFTIF